MLKIAYVLFRCSFILNRVSQFLSRFMGSCQSRVELGKHSLRVKRPRIPTTETTAATLESKVPEQVGWSLASSLLLLCFGSAAHTCNDLSVCASSRSSPPPHPPHPSTHVLDLFLGQFCLKMFNNKKKVKEMAAANAIQCVSLNSRCL